MNHPNVSKRCPSCGGSRYETKRTDRFGALALDRVCSACRTVYTPPTPAWKSLGLTVLGTLFLVGGPFAALHLRPLPFAVETKIYAFLGLMAAVPMVGIVALIHGLRLLIQGDARPIWVRNASGQRISELNFDIAAKRVVLKDIGKSARDRATFRLTHDELIRVSGTLADGTALSGQFVYQVSGVYRACFVINPDGHVDFAQRAPYPVQPKSCKVS